jgi:hypothetical protein
MIKPHNTNEASKVYTELADRIGAEVHSQLKEVFSISKFDQHEQIMFFSGYMMGITEEFLSYNQITNLKTTNKAIKHICDSIAPDSLWKLYMIGDDMFKSIIGDNTYKLITDADSYKAIIVSDTYDSTHVTKETQLLEVEKTYLLGFLSGQIDAYELNEGKCSSRSLVQYMKALARESFS